MIKGLTIQGRMTKQTKGINPWLAVDGVSLADLIPEGVPVGLATIERVVIKKNDEYVETTGFWAEGQEISLENLQEANSKHENDPESLPYYISSWILQDWGNVTIEIKFGDDP